MRSEKGQGWAELVIGLAVVVLVLFGIWFLIAHYTVASGEVGIVSTWGQVTGVVQPGFGWKNPFTQSVYKMNVQVQQYQGDESAASHDLQEVTTTVSVNFHPDPQFAKEIYVQYGTDYVKNILVPMVQDTVKSVTAEYPIDQLINDRETPRAESQDKLTTRAKSFHIIVDALNLTNFKPSDQYSQAIEAKQVAQQQAEQAQAVVAQKKAEAEQARQTAQGQADSAVIAAKGAADAQVIQAQAQAQANNLITKSLTPELLQYQYITKLAPTVQTIYVPNGQQFILPLTNTPQ